MATFTGIIKTSNPPIGGSITPDYDKTIELVFRDPTLQTRGITLVAGEAVSFDYDPNTGVSNVTPIVVDPNYPPDQGTVVSNPVNGDLTIDAGTATTISGTTVSGNIIVNGGTLVLKSTTQDGTVQALVQGHIRAMQNSTVIIYKSGIAGNLHFHDGDALTIHAGSVGGQTDIKNARSVIHAGSVGGQTDIKQAINVVVDTYTVNGAGNNFIVAQTANSTLIANVVVNSGDAIIRDNTGCSYKNITAPQGQVKMVGCNPA